MQKDNHLVGCCGISCSTCGLYIKNKCDGCTKALKTLFLHNWNINILICLADRSSDALYDTVQIKTDLILG